MARGRDLTEGVKWPREPPLVIADDWREPPIGGPIYDTIAIEGRLPDDRPHEACISRCYCRRRAWSDQMKSRGCYNQTTGVNLSRGLTSADYHQSLSQMSDDHHGLMSPPMRLIRIWDAQECMEP
jgi:hypothetical protein